MSNYHSFVRYDGGLVTSHGEAPREVFSDVLEEVVMEVRSGGSEIMYAFHYYSESHARASTRRKLHLL